VGAAAPLARGLFTYQQQPKMTVFREIAKSIVWLSGSLAGIVAVLIACGYLITIAHLNLLGLDTRVLKYDPQYYLERGGKFFFYILAFVSKDILLPLFLSFMVVVVVFLCCYLVLVRKLFSAGFQRLAQGLKGHVERHATIYRMLVLLLLLGLLFSKSLPVLDELYIKPLTVSNVLYDLGTADVIEDKTMAAIIQQGHIHFNRVLFCLILATLLLYGAWKATSTLPFRMVMRSPFVIVFLTYILFLPMVYGVFIIPIEFSPIDLRMKNATLRQPAPLYLINQSPDEFIVWDCGQRELLWLPKNEVDRATIRRSEMLYRQTRSVEPAEKPSSHAKERPER
jgi:hypothetical protein